VNDYFRRWPHDGRREQIHHALYHRCREMACRNDTPTTAITDSQRIESAEKGGLTDPPGFDAGKKIKGKKRHLPVDTQGFLIQAIVHPTTIQDRDGGLLLRGGCSDGIVHC